MAVLGPYLVACALLVAAGAAKLVEPGHTALAVLGMATRGPVPTGRSRRAVSGAVRVGAAVELAIGLAAGLHPDRLLAVLVGASYLGFAAFVAAALTTGRPIATCGCFGEPDTPPDVRHLAVDLGLAVAAALQAAAGWGSGRTGGEWLWHALSGMPWHGVPFLAATALSTVLVGAIVTLAARVEAARRPLRRARG